MRWPTPIITDRALALVGAVLISWALLVLAAAFLAICYNTGSAWPWNVIVHEDGKRTLLNTLLYYEHATRELPIDVLLGVAIGSAASFALPAARTVRPFMAGSAFGLLALIIVILFGTAASGGLHAVMENLLQNHTRSGAPLVWGSHWRYHLLERGPMILLSLGLGGLLCALSGQATGGRKPRVALGAATLYLLLTLVFTRNMEDLRLPFLDARYLGHQAREIFTHSLVTLPLGWGAVLASLQMPNAPFVQKRIKGSFRWPSIAIIGAVACYLYVLLAALASDAAAQGQSDNIITLIAPHFFEHGFSYLVTPLTAVLTCTLCAGVPSASAVPSPRSAAA